MLRSEIQQLLPKKIRKMEYIREHLGDNPTYPKLMTQYLLDIVTLNTKLSHWGEDCQCDRCLRYVGYDSDGNNAMPEIAGENDTAKECRDHTNNESTLHDVMEEKEEIKAADMGSNSSQSKSCSTRYPSPDSNNSRKKKIKKKAKERKGDLSAAKAQKEIDKLKQQIMELTQHMQQLKAAYEDDLATKENKFQQKSNLEREKYKNAIAGKSSRYETQIRDLQLELSSIKTAKRVAEHDISELEDSMKELRHEHATEKDQWTAKLQELELVMAENAALSGEARMYKRKFDNTQFELAQLHVQYQRMRRDRELEEAASRSSRRSIFGITIATALGSALLFKMTRQ